MGLRRSFNFAHSKTLAVLVLLCICASLEMLSAVEKDTDDSWNPGFSADEASVRDGQERYSRSTATRRYTVSTLTGTRKGHGTKSKIYITLFGTSQALWQQLNNSDDDFERAECSPYTRRDVFLLDMKDVGTNITYIGIRGQSLNIDSWYLVDVQVTPQGGVTQTFPCNCLISDFNPRYL